MNLYWTLQPFYEDDLFLSPPERERLSQMRFPKRRTEWLSGRWAAKLLLQRAFPQAAFLLKQDISVLNAPDGAPYVTLNGELLEGSLSISHSHGQVLCALGLGRGFRLGVDLEKIEPRHLVFAEDYFTATEAAYVRSLCSAERDRWVTLAWSGREAVLKALGIGLRADTRSFEVIPGSLAEEEGWKPLSLRSVLMEDHIQKHGGSWGIWWQQEGEFILTAAVCSAEAAVFIRV